MAVMAGMSAGPAGTIEGTGTRTFLFDMPQPIPTYLLALAVVLAVVLAARAVGAFACEIAAGVAIERLIRLMEPRDVARDSELPATGVPLDWERVLSAIQIRANGYGTRTTTVLTVRNDALVTFFERTFDTGDPDRWTDRHFEFMVDNEAFVRTDVSRHDVDAPGGGRVGVALVVRASFNCCARCCASCCLRCAASCSAFCCAALASSASRWAVRSSSPKRSTSRCRGIGTRVAHGIR